MNPALADLRQGRDFDAPRDLLAAISAESAARSIPGAPYTVLGNLAHANAWQRLWLQRLRGEPETVPETEDEDWPTPDPSAWPTLRDEFCDGIDAAADWTGDDPHRVLPRIALHAAYHLGQIVLLQRLAAG